MSITKETEDEIQHFFELALATQEVSQELSKTMISNMLHSMKENDVTEPKYFKKMFCFKCFSIFKLGENCKVSLRTIRKHPNLKIIEYHCLCCQHTQRINAIRSKTPPTLPPPKEENVSRQKPPPNQQRKRKLLMNLFS